MTIQRSSKRIDDFNYNIRCISSLANDVLHFKKKCVCVVHLLLTLC